MFERIAADAVLVLHLAFVLFALLGGLLALRAPGFAWLHLPALAWAAFVEFTGRVCPLTPLEVALRRAASDSGYAGGFVEHYIVALLYPEALTRDVQMVLGATLVVLNVVIYGAVVFHLRRARAS